jgi:hypothetical protein
MLLKMFALDATALLHPMCCSACKTMSGRKQSQEIELICRGQVACDISLIMTTVIIPIFNEEVIYKHFNGAKQIVNISSNFRRTQRMLFPIHLIVNDFIVVGESFSTNISLYPPPTPWHRLDEQPVDGFYSCWSPPPQLGPMRRAVAAASRATHRGPRLPAPETCRPLPIRPRPCRHAVLMIVLVVVAETAAVEIVVETTCSTRFTFRILAFTMPARRVRLGRPRAMPRPS